MSTDPLPQIFNNVPPSPVKEKRKSKLWTDLDLRVLALTLAVQYAVGTDDPEARVEVGDLTSDYYEFLKTGVYPSEPDDDDPEPDEGEKTIHPIVDLAKHKLKKAA